MKKKIVLTISVALIGLSINAQWQQTNIKSAKTLAKRSLRPGTAFPEY